MVVSRMMKREKNKLVKQSMLAIALSVFLAVAFLFVVLPNAPRLIGLVVGNSKQDVNNDNFPPQVPIIQLSTRNTNQPSFILQGYSEPKSRVKLMHNDDELDEIVANDSGIFEIKIGLVEGENTFSATAIDQAENVSSQSKPEKLYLDTEPPDLSWDESIVDGMSVIGKDKQFFSLKGQTESGAKITVNDRFFFAKADGSFEYRLRLQEGENQLVIKLEDKASNQTVKNLKLFFKP